MKRVSGINPNIVAEEAKFVLHHLAGDRGFFAEVSFHDLERVCGPSLSLPLSEYLTFLEQGAYLVWNRETEHVVLTERGDELASGGNTAQFDADVVRYFVPTATLQPKPSSTIPKRAKSVSGTLGNSEHAYEKVREIGAGGLGTVFLARQSALARHVAYKEIRQLFEFFTENQHHEIVRKFDEEVREAARLFHPGIVVLIDADTSCDFPYLVSEFLPGGNLRPLIQQRLLTPETTLQTILQVLHALGYAHEQNVIHRGIKPENVLLDAVGNVKLTDFGIGRAVEQDSATMRHVYVGTGSVTYMAPELLASPSAAGPQADLYSVGILFYEMLSGKLPGRRSPMPTEIHPQLPRAMDDIFDRLTQDNREDRYQSVDEVLAAFHETDLVRSFFQPRSQVILLNGPLSDTASLGGLVEGRGERGRQESTHESIEFERDDMENRTPANFDDKLASKA